MADRKVISGKYLPTHLPTVPTAVAVMAMDLYGSAGWVWGLACGVLGIYWIASLSVMFTETGVHPADIERRKG